MGHGFSRGSDHSGCYGDCLTSQVFIKIFLRTFTQFSQRDILQMYKHKEA